MTSAIINQASAYAELADVARPSIVAAPVALTRSQMLRVSGMQPKPPQPQLSWRFPWRTVAAFALAATVAVTQPWKTLRSEPVSVESNHSTALRTVAIDRPAPATTASIVLPATIRPWQTTSLHARVSGYLVAWHKELGASVKANDLLAEIETPELDQELAEGEALANEAKAAAVQAQAERTEAQAELRTAEAQLARVRAEAKLAELQLARRVQLLTTRAISREEYEEFQKQVEVRTADVAAAESDVARRRTNLDTRAAIIAAREATAASRRANVERLNELQRFKRIVAPFDGVVTHRSAEVGMLVTAGKEALFVVEDISRVRVQVNVPQAYAMQTRTGVAATVSVPESTAEAVRGTITRTAESIDSTNRTMLAEIELNNIAGHFQPGSYAQVGLTTPQNNSLWTVPTNTVQMRVEGPHIALVNDQNRIEIKPVHLGRDLGNRVVVTDGIRGDERLIVNPGDDLVNGVQVQTSSRDPDRKIAQR